MMCWNRSVPRQRLSSAIASVRLGEPLDAVRMPQELTEDDDCPTPLPPDRDLLHCASTRPDRRSLNLQWRLPQSTPSRKCDLGKERDRRDEGLGSSQRTWRRRGDSNPRYAFTAYNGLANRRLQPLGHVSFARSTRIDAGSGDCKQCWPASRRAKVITARAGFDGPSSS